jgi:hypothetical protein
MIASDITAAGFKPTAVLFWAWELGSNCDPGFVSDYTDQQSRSIFVG